MAQRNRENPGPRLVVKIVGGKQVKQFIEETREERDAALDSFWNPSENRDGTASGSDRREPHRGDSALWAAINQVPDRLCVTAPSGDRSRSYIHPKTRRRAEPGAAEVLQVQQQEAAPDESQDEAELSSAVREQLSDWQMSCLRSAEVAAAALDLASSGTLDRSQITRLFLDHGVPLKLPTFALLLTTFADRNDPMQIEYKNLLQFIEDAVFPRSLCP